MCRLSKDTDPLTPPFQSGIQDYLIWEWVCIVRGDRRDMILISIYRIDDFQRSLP